MEKIVYLLEDDDSICELVKCAFDISGIRLEYFMSVEELDKAMQKKLPSVLLLDIMLSDGNGIEVLQKVKKEHPEIICVMLSALSKETDKVKCLNLGADDYVAKPFGVLELTARVNACLRRIKDVNIIKRGVIELNPDKMTVSVEGKLMDLNRKEFKVLKFLMENEGKALTRDEILERVWGFDEGETRTLDNHIARLRKIGIPYIETVFGTGYKFSVK